MVFSFQSSKACLIATLATVLCSAMSGCDSDSNSAPEPSVLGSLSVNETQYLSADLMPTEVLPGSLRPPTK